MKFRKIIFCFVLLFVLSACSDNNIGRQQIGAKEIGFEEKGITKEKYYIEVEKQVEGDSMEPLIQPEEKLVLLQDYYDCHEVRRGDIVSYDYGGKEVPIVKRVAVMGGDELFFSENKLIVNGQSLKNSIGEEYLFNEKEQKMISLYIVDGRLTNNGYLIFGDNVNHSLDSRFFGAVGKADFFGKFEL